MLLYVLVSFVVVSLLLVVISTYFIGITCQRLRRQFGLDDDVRPAGGFEVIRRADESADVKTTSA